jgi:hypothetical protein
MAQNTVGTAEVDHFTPLSRAVASIDRDAYAARFAIYDRAHKALLRRLATAVSPPTSEDIEREEKAFRDAVRRVEFANELAQEEEGDAEAEAESPALAPQEPVGEEALHELRRDPWPDVRPRRDDVDEEGAYAGEEPDIDLESLAPHGLRRSVTRRVAERMLLAVLVLALGGVWLYIADGREQAAEAERAIPQTSEAVASDSTAAPAVAPTVETRSSVPDWLSSPELFYTAPPLPTVPATARAARPETAARRQ